MAGRRRGRGVAPAASRARRPRRPAEVRLQRRPQRARARQRARDGGPRRRRRDREGVPARARRRASTATCCGSPRSRRRAPDDLAPEDFAGVDDSPVRCLDSEAAEAMVAEIDRLRKENESLGGMFEVRGVRARCPASGSHVSWDGAARRPAGAGDRLDPGGQGRLRGRGLGGRRPCPARSRTTRSSTRTSAAGTARRTAPAASRAG